MWQRYNQTSHIFEKSTNDGATWTPLGLNASIITEGVFDIARIPSIPDGYLPANVAYKNIDNQFSTPQSIKTGTPALWFVDTGVASQAGDYRIVASLNALYIQRINPFTSYMFFQADGAAYFASHVNTSGQFITPVQVQTPRVLFPNGQDPSSSPNCLDDYEEGAWSPILNGDSGNSTGQVYAVNVGRYVKVGLQVTLTFDVKITSWAVAAAGNLIVMGLPFYNDASVPASGVISYWDTLGGSVVNIMMRLGSGLWFSYLSYAGSAAANSGQLVFGNMVAGTRLMGTITYRAQA